MPKILALYPPTSGIDNYLFPALINRGWQLRKIDIGYPAYLKYAQLISAFSPNIAKWKTKFSEKQILYLKSPQGFRQRTKFCQGVLKRLKGDYDLIFQVSGMFAPSFNGSQAMYVLFLDWTRKLSEREWPDWAPITDITKRAEWFSLEQDVYRKAKLIFTVSEYTKKSVVNDYGISPDKVVVTGYGPTLDKIPDDNYKKEYDGKTILFVGFDFKRKGGYVLLEAFKKAREVIKDARLIIVGPTNLKVDIEGVESRGALNKEEVVKLYEQASIFAMPSLCEPFGLVFLEAMAYKLPCIGTNVDAMSEIIEDGKTGFLARLGDPANLAEKIIYLLSNSKMLENIGNYGFRHIQVIFNWNTVIEKIEGALKGLSANG